MNPYPIRPGTNSRQQEYPQKSAFGFPYDLVDQHHPQRDSVERFINRQYRISYGARVAYFSPLLITVFDNRNKPLSTLGVSHASAGQLFLEYYLTERVETAIGNEFSDQSLAVHRSQIAEIGNLASTHTAARVCLFKILVLCLSHWNIDWIVATGGRPLQTIFRRHGLTTHCLAEARESHLPQHYQGWGSYYDDHPVVIAGKVQNGIKLLRPRSNGGIVQ